MRRYHLDQFKVFIAAEKIEKEIIKEDANCNQIK